VPTVPTSSHHLPGPSHRTVRLNRKNFDPREPYHLEISSYFNLICRFRLTLATPEARNFGFEKKKLWLRTNAVDGQRPVRIETP